MDIGSNTTRLLVAEVEHGAIRELAAVREFTLLGSAAADDGTIPPRKIVETAATVAAQVDAARRLGAQLIAIVGTAMLRRAPNAAELQRAVEQTTGFPLRVLSEAAEAELSFLGATAVSGLDGGTRIAVVDVGGGSSEVAVGTRGRVPDWWQSMPIGSAALARECIVDDPPSADQIARCRARASAAADALEPPPVDVALAVGGSATSLRLLAGAALDGEAVDKVLAVLAGSHCADVARDHSLDIRRVKLLPAGVAILGAIAARLGVPLELAQGGLREGVILRLADASV